MEMRGNSIYARLNNARRGGQDVAVNVEQLGHLDGCTMIAAHALPASLAHRGGRGWIAKEGDDGGGEGIRRSVLRGDPVGAVVGQLGDPPYGAGGRGNP